MTRRVLLAMLAAAAVAACRAPAPIADTPQQRESVAVTLAVSGMI